MATRTRAIAALIGLTCTILGVVGGARTDGAARQIGLSALDHIVGGATCSTQTCEEYKHWFKGGGTGSKKYSSLQAYANAYWISGTKGSYAAATGDNTKNTEQAFSSYSTPPTCLQTDSYSPCFATGVPVGEAKVVQLYVCAYP